MRVELAVDAYLRSSRYVQKHSKSHLTSQERTLYKLIDGAKGKELDAITTADIYALVETVAPKLSPNSLILMHRILSAFFAWAMAQHGLATNPVKGVPKPAPSETTENRRRLIHGAAIKRLKPHVPKWAHNAMVVMWSMGLRYGEVSRIKIADLDVSAMELHIPRAKKRKQRRVPVPDHVVATAIVELATGPRIPEHKLFNYYAAAACKKAGVPRFSAHALRHAAITNWANAGCSIYDAASWAGHASVTQTEAYFCLERLAVKLPPPSGF